MITVPREKLLDFPFCSDYPVERMRQIVAAQAGESPDVGLDHILTAPYPTEDKLWILLRAPWLTEADLVSAAFEFTNLLPPMPQPAHVVTMAQLAIMASEGTFCEEQMDPIARGLDERGMRDYKNFVEKSSDGTRRAVLAMAWTCKARTHSVPKADSEVMKETVKRMMLAIVAARVRAREASDG